jgi:hypothetical protein
MRGFMAGRRSRRPTLLGTMTPRRGAALLLAVGAWGATPGSALADGFLAGAGQADATPPAAGSAAGNAADANFASQFASCPPMLGAAKGRFALQEPFTDQNHHGQWDPNASLGGPPTGPPDPFCDANANGHWDGMYSPNGNGPEGPVHDPIDVRAVALSDGHDRPVVYASAKQIGIFDFYTDAVRADLVNKYHVDADLVVTANHNESSPDSIGLYGALQTPVGVGVRSGIDDYYMSFLEDRIAQAAADAVHNLRPAQLYASQVEGSIPSGATGDSYPLLTGMSQRISDQFPTTVKLPGDNRIAAVDTKLGVLQAREADGTPIFTAMSLAAHNQEMGNTREPADPTKNLPELPAISADWPGAFEQAFDSSHAGTSIFVVGDNGSEEDPQTTPTVIPKGSENHTTPETQFIQARATGQRFAQIVSDAARTAQPLTPGTVRLSRQQFCVPLENNGFLALGAAGEFGRRQGYVCDPNENPVQALPTGFAAPNAGARFRTFVGVTDVGPDLQLIDNPGEAFPALMLGSPFTMSEASCNRPNPAVPTWHSNRLFRFQVGLADDLIGYLIPPWGFASGTPGLFNNDACFQDMNGHGHKLESESVGPTGAANVANRLAALLDAEKDPSARIPGGRFVRADGSYSSWPTGAVGILIPPPSSSALDPNGGTLIGGPGVQGFGVRAVDATGAFMDYDGQPQAGPDVTTRGMMTFDAQGCVSARYYLDVFPTLDTSKPVAGVVAGGGAPSVACPFPNRNGVPEVQTALQRQLSTGGFLGPGGRRLLPSRSGCADRTPPRSSIRGRRGGRVRTARARRSVVRLRGRASDRGCGGQSGVVVRVTVTISRRQHGRGCRFVTPAGGLTAPRDCRQPLLLLARGTTRWSFHLALHVPLGRYRVVVRALDAAGNFERAQGRRANLVRLRVP